MDPYAPNPEDRFRPLPPLPGASLDPEQILGRDRDAATAFELLRHGNLRLNEPRRLGKTSLLTLLAARPAPGWVVVNQSFQGVGSTTEMVEYALSGIASHQRLRKKAKDAAKAALSNTTVKANTADGHVFELAARFADDPLHALTSALSDVAQSLHRDERLLLAWDEVPDMAKAIADSEGDAAATRALGILRRLREDLGGTRSGIRWILTGSVGFHHVLRQVGRDDLVNDLMNLSLGPLDEAWTLHLAERLLRGAGCEPDLETVEAVAVVSGGIPVLVHLIAAQVQFGARIEAAGDVDGIFRSAVGKLDASHQFTSFLTRLGPYYTDDEDAACWILDQLVAGPMTRADLAGQAPRRLGLARDAHLRAVLGWLELDHYLVRDLPASDDLEATYRWRYEPLRRIWELRRA